jgi:hypothetical protein
MFLGAEGRHHSAQALALQLREKHRFWAIRGGLTEAENRATGQILPSEPHRAWGV